MPTKLKQHALPWLWLSLLVIVLDQLTKAIVIHALEPQIPHAVVPGVLNWTLAYNTGAAFSFLADAEGWQRWFFSILAIGFSLVATRWLAQTERSDWRSAMPLALVIGGAIGNLIDRLRIGHVTDFIQVYYQQWTFPAFNIADSAISVGAVLLVWFGLFARHKEP